MERDPIRGWSHGEASPLVLIDSALPNSGRGVRTRVFISKNTLVTLYDGIQCDKTKALEKRDRGQDGYLRTLDCQYTYIDGFRAPLQGRGLGSFLNDANGLVRVPGLVNNCVFKKKTQGHVARIMVVASVDIPADSELFVSYGRQYWKLEPMRAALRRQHSQKKKKKKDYVKK